MAAFGGSPVRQAGRVESGALILKFESGCVAAISFADTAPSPWGFEAGTGENPNIGKSGEDMLWITGTRGSVSFPSMSVWTGAEEWSQVPCCSRLDTTETTPLVAQLDHFCQVIEGLAEPLISAKDGRETLAVALAAQQAISSTMYRERMREGA